MDKSKQVSQSTGVPYLHVRLYAHLGSRDKNSGPRAARTSQMTTSQCGSPSKPLACLKHIIVIIARHPVILDSFIALIHYQMYQSKQLSMSEHYRYIKALATHTSKPSYARSSGYWYLGDKNKTCIR
jgi:hypothetical protein